MKIQHSSRVFAVKTSKNDAEMMLDPTGLSRPTLEEKGKMSRLLSCSPDRSFAFFLNYCSCNNLAKSLRKARKNKSDTPKSIPKFNRKIVSMILEKKIGHRASNRLKSCGILNYCRAIFCNNLGNLVIEEPQRACLAFPKCLIIIKSSSNHHAMIWAQFLFWESWFYPSTIHFLNCCKARICKNLGNPAIEEPQRVCLTFLKCLIVVKLSSKTCVITFTRKRSQDTQRWVLILTMVMHRLL